MVDQTQVRLLAPAALVVFFIAFVVVVATSGGGDEPVGRTGAAAPTATVRKPAPRPRRTYVVRVGDNLQRISDRFGIPVDDLRRLNPDLDPQALGVGQRIRLRR